MYTFRVDGPLYYLLDFRTKVEIHPVVSSVITEKYCFTCFTNYNHERMNRNALLI